MSVDKATVCRRRAGYEKTKAKASEPGGEDAKSEIQRDSEEERKTKGETTYAAIHKAGSVTWTWKG